MTLTGWRGVNNPEDYPRTSYVNGLPGDLLLVAVEDPPDVDDALRMRGGGLAADLPEVVEAVLPGRLRSLERYARPAGNNFMYFLYSLLTYLPVAELLRYYLLYLVYTG